MRTTQIPLFLACSSLIAVGQILAKITTENELKAFCQKLNETAIYTTTDGRTRKWSPSTKTCLETIRLLKSAETVFEAEQGCAQTAPNGTVGRLAHFPDSSSVTAAETLIPRLHVFRGWIGARKIGSSWQWVENNETSSTNFNSSLLLPWSEGPLPGNCLMMTGSSDSTYTAGVSNYNCETVLHGKLCEYYLSETTTSSAAPSFESAAEGQTLDKKETTKLTSPTSTTQHSPTQSKATQISAINELQTFCQKLKTSIRTKGPLYQHNFYTTMEWSPTTKTCLQGIRLLKNVDYEKFSEAEKSCGHAAPNGTIGRLAHLPDSSSVAAAETVVARLYVFRGWIGGQKFGSNWQWVENNKASSTNFNVSLLQPWSEPLQTQLQTPGNCLLMTGSSYAYTGVTTENCEHIHSIHSKLCEYYLKKATTSSAAPSFESAAEGQTLDKKETTKLTSPTSTTQHSPTDSKATQISTINELQTFCQKLKTSIRTKGPLYQHNFYTTMEWSPTTKTCLQGIRLLKNVDYEKFSEAEKSCGHAAPNGTIGRLAHLPDSSSVAAAETVVARLYVFRGWIGGQKFGSNWQWVENNKASSTNFNVSLLQPWSEPLQTQLQTPGNCLLMTGSSYAYTGVTTENCEHCCIHSKLCEYYLKKGGQTFVHEDKKQPTKSTNQGSSAKPSSPRTNTGNLVSTTQVYIIIPSIAALLIIAACFISIIIVYCKKQHTWSAHMDLARIDKDQIKMIQKIGEGHFGEVWKGEIKNKRLVSQTVAIKVLKLTAQDKEKRQFFEEAFILGKLQGHRYIVSALGLCLDSRPNMLVLEFLTGGCLEKFLQNDKCRNSMQHKQLIHIARDISKACCFLEEKGYIHRDIAARNCLVEVKDPSSNIPNITKLSDFGLAKDEKSIYMTADPELPVAWAAPEAFIHGIFSIKSDVWSYGVLLWEIFCYGAQPYGKCSRPPTSHNCPSRIFSHAQIEKHVCQHQKTLLDIPDPCTAQFTEYLKEMMALCWQFQPDLRPCFSTICKLLLKAEFRCDNIQYEAQDGDEVSVASASQKDLVVGNDLCKVSVAASDLGGYNKLEILNSSLTTTDQAMELKPVLTEYSRISIIGTPIIGTIP